MLAFSFPIKRSVLLMTQHWHVTDSSLEIASMPFYWRLGSTPFASAGVPQRLGIRVTADEHFDYLKFVPTAQQWATMDEAYRRNENIGFLNPESGQLGTYGASVNKFFLGALRQSEARRVYEIGCGAGYSIQFLKERGYDVTGIDPSEYSLRWSERLGFKLINRFFHPDALGHAPDFIYCNDVFEHVPDVVGFSKMVYDSLDSEGTFCFATTNSTRSIALGDISMLEHQHVNMFTERSLRLILAEAGFGSVDVESGSYGNTFHVRAHKAPAGGSRQEQPRVEGCRGFFERASACISRFLRLHDVGRLRCYVPLRCIPYLSAAGDFGTTAVYDSNTAWRGKYIDGYGQPILSIADVVPADGESFFVGSLTFSREIRKSLVERGWPESRIHSIDDLP
jgi:SAM-dependent methyltransferase